MGLCKLNREAHDKRKSIRPTACDGPILTTFIADGDKDDSAVIDFVYTIDGIETNSGYTVFVENGVCTELYGNTINGKIIDKNKINSLKKSINTKKIKN